MFATVAGSTASKARREVVQAYRPGYREAAARAGIDVHVLPLALASDQVAAQQASSREAARG